MLPTESCKIVNTKYPTSKRLGSKGLKTAMPQLPSPLPSAYLLFWMSVHYQPVGSPSFPPSRGRPSSSHPSCPHALHPNYGVGG